MKRLFVVLLLSVAASSGAQQDDRARTEALARTTSERLKALNQEADRLASEARTLLGDLRRLELERQIKDEELRQAKADEDRVAAESDFAQRRNCRGSRRRSRPNFPRCVRGSSSCTSSGKGGYLRLFLSTTEARNIGQASRMVAAIASRDRDRIAAHQRRVEESEARRIALEERRAQLASLRAAAERAQAAAPCRRAEARSAHPRHRPAPRSERAAGGRADEHPAASAGHVARAAVGCRRDRTRPLGRRACRSPRSAANSSGPRSVRSGTVSARARRPPPARPTASRSRPSSEPRAGRPRGYGRVRRYLRRLRQARHHRPRRRRPSACTGTCWISRWPAAPACRRAIPLERLDLRCLGVPGLYFELRVDGQPVDPLQWLRKR